MTFQIKPDVPCMAIADRLDMQVGGGSWQWRVTVKTAPFVKHQHRKVYFIEAFSDTLAAREGIRRFCEEARRGALPLELQTVH